MQNPGVVEKLRQAGFMNAVAANTVVAEPLAQVMPMLGASVTTTAPKLGTQSYSTAELTGRR